MAKKFARLDKIAPQPSGLPDLNLSISNESGIKIEWVMLGNGRVYPQVSFFFDGFAAAHELAKAIPALDPLGECPTVEEVEKVLRQPSLREDKSLYRKDPA